MRGGGQSAFFLNVEDRGLLQCALRPLLPLRPVSHQHRNRSRTRLLPCHFAVVRALRERRGSCDELCDKPRHGDRGGISAGPPRANRRGRRRKPCGSHEDVAGVFLPRRGFVLHGPGLPRRAWHGFQGAAWRVRIHPQARRAGRQSHFRRRPTAFGAGGG